MTPLAQHVLLAVDVVEEQLERREPLHEAALDAGPLVGRHHARHQAHRHDLLRAALVRIDGEGHALLRERQLGQRLAAGKLVRRQAVNQVHRHLGVLAGLAVRLDQLVVRTVERTVPVEDAERSGRTAPKQSTAKASVGDSPPGQARMTPPKRGGYAPFYSSVVNVYSI